MNSKIQSKSLIKNRAALSMFSLTLPIIGETFFRTLVSSLDTVMLSTYNDSSVAAVGMMGQYIFFTQLLFTIVCTGVSIVLAQYIGAEKNDKAKKIVTTGTALSLCVGVLVTLFGVFLTKPILSCYSLDEDVRTFATQYFIIFGGLGALATSFNMLQGSILKAYGHTKDALIGSIVANLINVGGNAIVIYALNNEYTVAGVACSSVLSQIISCIIYAIFIRQRPEIKISFKGLFHFDKQSYRTILKIGLPTAGESISYNVAQITIMAMVSTLGTASMSALVYAQTIVRFVYILANSIGQAVQIKTGYYVGSNQSDVAYKKVYKYQIIGTCCSAGVIILINIFSNSIASLFTKNSEIISLLQTLLLFSIYYEIGRSMNLITISALKGSGDVSFPVFYGIFSMWGIMALGSYIFGIKLGFGLLAIWLSIATDEFSRGVVMVLRWKSKKWMCKEVA